VSTSNYNKEILKKSQEESETEVDTESDINKFKNLDLNKMTLENGNDSERILMNNYKEKYVTHTSIIHNWYPKPPDLQLKELGIRAVYTADTLYKWNIDGLSKYEILNGLSEYEILNILYEIMMTTNTYKSDYQI
jgi:hypothetical protein